MKVIDMHCDTLSELVKDMDTYGKSSLLCNNHHLDLTKMQRGDYLMQCFAVFIDLELCENPLAGAERLIDMYYDQLEKNKDIISPVYKYSDIEDNINFGKMSVMLTGEEGDICLGDLEVLRQLYKKGLRMMTLTWNHENRLGYPNYYIDNRDGTILPDKAASKGLKEKGFEFIAEMERLNMIIDVSHLSDEGFWDVYKNTKKPFVASHSNARSVCSHVRNLTDDMLCAMGKRGCITGLNYYGTFLDEAGVTKKGHDSKLEHIIAHAKHIVKIGGIDMLALGSDFDGISGKLELRDASYMPKLYDALKKSGFHESEIDKIFYKNALRTFKELLG